MKKEDIDNEKNITLSEDEIIEQLLKGVPKSEFIPLDLPSKNRFYKLKNPAKPISIRPMTFEDEKAMVSKKNVNVDILNLLLSRCVDNIDVSQLLQMDKLYMIMKLRSISYGDEYQATINCSSCRKDNNIIFNLDNLPVNYIDDDLSDPVIVKLPVLGKEVALTLPRISDEQYFNSAESTISNLWRFVESIDGHTSKSLISKIIPQLPLKDSKAILSSLSTAEYGIQTKVRFICDFCGHNELMELPITGDFFTGN